MTLKCILQLEVCLRLPKCISIRIFLLCFDSTIWLHQTKSHYKTFETLQLLNSYTEFRLLDGIILFTICCLFVILNIKTLNILLYRLKLHSSWVSTKTKMHSIKRSWTKLFTKSWCLCQPNWVILLYSKQLLFKGYMQLFETSNKMQFGCHGQHNLVQCVCHDNHN